MMPLGAPSISKYGSLVRPDAQMVALRLRLPPSTINEGDPCVAVSLTGICNPACGWGVYMCAPCSFDKSQSLYGG